MAQVVRKSKALAAGFLKYRAIGIAAYIACAACFILFAVNMFSFNFKLLLPLMVGMGVCGVIGGKMMQKANTLGSGLEGEGVTAQIIERLPETFCGFQNLTVTFDGEESELDMVVVGLSGVFVIETKNMNGTICGDGESKTWTQHKVGQQGTPYSRDFYSPVKQVGTHVYRLANYLRQNGFAVHVDKMVFFSNPETQLALTNVPPHTPVFDARHNGAEKMLQHIYAQPQKLSREELLRLVLFLDGKDPDSVTL